MELLVEATAALYVDDDELNGGSTDEQLSAEEANAKVKAAWLERYETLLQEFEAVGPSEGHDRDWFANTLHDPIKRACALLPGRGVPPENEEHALDVLALLDHAIYKLVDSLLQRTPMIQIIIGLGYVRLLLDEYIPSMQSALDAITRSYGENADIKLTCRELKQDLDLIRKALQIFVQQHRHRSQPVRLNKPALENLRIEMDALVKELTDPEEDAVKEGLRAEFEKILRTKWPECRLKIFGSSKSTLGFKGSDMDLALLLPMDSSSYRAAMATKDSENGDHSDDADDGDFPGKIKGSPAHKFQASVVLDLIDLLGEDGPYAGVFKKVEGIPTARVPIVKLVHARTGIHCDVGINSHLGLLNTKLLRVYTEMDPRLAFAIKYWAKQRGVNDPAGGTLSSYAWVIMLIHFLQQQRVLSCLQDLRICHSQDAQQGNGIVFCDNPVEAFSIMQGVNQTHIGELLNKRDYRASTRQRKWRIAIQDPLEPDHDLGSVVYDPAGEIRIVNELERAILYVMSGDFTGLCQEAEDRSPIIRSCTSCGECGHTTKDCELGQGACRNCGKVGHYIKNCPEPPSEAIGACHKCGANGHWSRDCDGVDRRTCNICGELGHFARDCSKSNRGPPRCRNCNQPGHMAKDCNRIKRVQPHACRSCGQKGHMAKDCRAAKPPRQQPQDTCRNCGRPGHVARDCRSRTPPNTTSTKPPSVAAAPQRQLSSGNSNERDKYYEMQRGSGPKHNDRSAVQSLPRDYYEVQRLNFEAHQRRSMDNGHQSQNQQSNGAYGMPGSSQRGTGEGGYDRNRRQY